MNNLFNQLLYPQRIEYLIVNENLVIVEASLAVDRFADSPSEAIPGKDVRLGFPEFIGIENILHAILNKQQSNFEIKEIARHKEANAPLYIDLYVNHYQDRETKKNRLLILFENITEKMLMKQHLVQRANEANLLLSALAASKNYIDKIITSMGDALLVTTLAGTIKTANQAAQFLFGYSEAELINQPLSLIIPNGQLLHQSNPETLAVQGESWQEAEIICCTKTGSEIVVEFSCSAIQTDIEGLYDFVYIGRDITARKQEEAEIRLALAQEKEMRELKARFFSMVSHEFGNPISTVLFSVALLKQYNAHITEEEKREYIHHIQTAARYMVELLNDLRFLGSAEAGKLQFNPTLINLEQFCIDLVEEIKLGTGRKHNLQFTKSGVPHLDIGDEPEEKLTQMDAKLLRHILTNLLLNAIKYSTKGSTVYFGLSWQEREVIFKIKDEGMGIPTENQQQLFEAFYRANNVGEIPGTGLGLAIVKQSVDLHGGKIEFTSKIGAGTTFTVRIPLECSIPSV